MTNEYFERILFTMNNIKDIEFANAVLAAAITTSDVNEYPSIDFEFSSIVILNLLMRSFCMLI